ncbi:IS5 family transposase [Saprospira sp. CCB-QB6]|uniref:IS5 family transposase n=1 Tax=Saprospira sp. CCB-QB6 TaxID=3023936 RepID=UPI00234A78E2|nr:IS5 family transposase [Saprospira sp. CCB-QB6]WCL83078.1 IS5 family transposase [Saprospira sp. CCB-QB6]WCL83079.1 IS5 family transposase [Saprospira sp. CCB-QB6]WCL83080.1 IS5 family transposase [Saprospira sp. CCB-QB6]WCL83082.1 IS5 family transposase [Saprospira sp. CCB-QB6]WCL83083.1 IS5 family transposase [Saprospira sp. CCB-QB6]
MQNYALTNRFYTAQGKFLFNVWFPPLASKNLIAKPSKRGRPKTISDEFIRYLFRLKVLFSFGYRQLEGILKCVISKYNLDAKPISFTQIYRRVKKLKLNIKSKKRTKERSVAIDSTGLKTKGQGEWLRKKYLEKQRSSWIKVHLAVDDKTGEILSVEITTERKTDASQLPKMMKKMKSLNIRQVYADGAYDQIKCREAICKAGAVPFIPPRKNARLKKGKDGELVDSYRNDDILYIWELGATAWKQDLGYHRRNLSETAMMRLKHFFSERLSSLSFKMQKQEVLMRIQILNELNAVKLEVVTNQ